MKMIEFKITETFLFFESIPLTLHGRSSWWRTTLLLATTLDNMLTTSSLHSRFEVKRITLEMEESDLDYALMDYSAEFFKNEP